MSKQVLLLRYVAVLACHFFLFFAVFEAGGDLGISLKLTGLNISASFRAAALAFLSCFWWLVARLASLLSSFFLMVVKFFPVNFACSDWAIRMVCRRYSSISSCVVIIVFFSSFRYFSFFFCLASLTEELSLTGSPAS